MVVPLGELIAPAATQRAGTKIRPILSMTMHHGLVDQSEKFKKRVASTDTSDYKVVKKGQLVVGFPIDEGVLSVQALYPEAIVSPAYGIWDITPDIDWQYLEKYLRSPAALSYYRSKLRSTAARRRTLTRRDFLRLPVPTPGLSEQRKLVGILDQADELRAKRRESIARLDEFTHALFLNMFGSMEDSTRPIATKTLGEIARIGTGSTPSRSEPDNFGGEIPWVKTTEVQGGVIYSTSESISARGLRESNCRLYPKESILVALYGQGKTRGQVAKLGIPATTNQACAILEPNEDYSTDFLFAQLKMSYGRLRSMARGGNQANLNLQIVKNFEVLLPPLRDQRKFADHAARIDRQQEQQITQLSYLDDLFASLQQRAFRGEL